jgi:hypothetical protein
MMPYSPVTLEPDHLDGALKVGRQPHHGFNHGSMANAMLQATARRRPIRSPGHFDVRRRRLQHDDGGFYHPHPDGLPVKVIVLNNGTLGFVEMEMKANGFGYGL